LGMSESQLFEVVLSSKDSNADPRTEYGRGRRDCQAPAQLSVKSCGPSSFYLVAGTRTHSPTSSAPDFDLNWMEPAKRNRVSCPP
jgi:hypothetical protein